LISSGWRVSRDAPAALYFSVGFFDGARRFFCSREREMIYSAVS
jgi:hypothetical protein